MPHRSPHRLHTFLLLMATTLVAVHVSATDSLAAERVRCGQSYSGDAVLDRSCMGDIVIRGGSLNLAGHTVRGTIQCDGEFCEVYSDPPNGRVEGFGVPGSTGIRAGGGAVPGSGSLAVDGVIVSGFNIGVAASNVQLTNSLIAGNTGHGVDSLVSIEAAGTIVSLNGSNGLHARLGGVSLADSEVTENGANGVRALEGFIAAGSTIADNGGDGVRNFSAPALLVDSAVYGNGWHGVRSDDSDCTPTDELALVATTVDGNGLDPECGASRPCADVISCAQPVLRRGASCQTSHRMMSGLPGQSWQVCRAD
jgi:hypothetical protein